MPHIEEFCTNSPPFKSVFTMIEAIRPDPRKKLDLSKLPNSHGSCLRKIEMKEGIYDFLFLSSKKSHILMAKTGAGQGWSRPSHTRTSLHSQTELLFPFLLYYYRRKEIPRQMHSAKITLWLWHTLTKGEETTCQCSNSILGLVQLWKRKCFKGEQTWNTP